MSAEAPLEIGLLTPALRGWQGGEGGIASHFSELAAGLAEQGHHVRVLTFPVPGVPAGAPVPLPSNFEVIGLRAEMPAWLNQLTRWRWRCHTAAGRWSRIRQAAAAVDAAHRRRPFAAIETSSTEMLALDCVRRPSGPPIVTRVSTMVHQLVAHNSGRPGWHDRLADRWERRLVRRSDLVLTHTRRHRDEVADAFGVAAGEIAVIPHGIALPPLSALPAVCRESGSPLRLLFVGRCERRKGIDTLLAALPRVLAACPTAEVSIVGRDDGGFWERRWKETPGAGAAVRFHGPRDDAALQAAYRDCDLFVAPSRYESFGLTYVEAMAWGKPVVGCAVGGVPEVVAAEETGLLVPPDRPEALAVALIGLLRDPDRRAAMGRAGRRRVEQNFSRAALAQASAALYRRAATLRP